MSLSLGMDRLGLCNALQFDRQNTGSTSTTAATSVTDRPGLNQIDVKVLTGIVTVEGDLRTSLRRRSIIYE